MYNEWQSPPTCMWNCLLLSKNGSSHKYTYNAKGDSGRTYWLLCSAHGQVVAAADEDCEEGEDVVVHQMKLSQLLAHSHSDNEILESSGRLQHNYHSMPKGPFTIWQKAFGTCACLLDMDLRRAGLQPASQYCHDWTHCFVSAGIVQKAGFVLCSNLKPHGWNVDHDYLKLWRWPSHLPRHLDGLFNTKS